MQGGRSWLAFMDRSRIPQGSRRACICKFSRQKHRFFYICGKTGNLWLSIDLHTQARSLKHPFQDFQTPISRYVLLFTKLLFYKNSLKALQKRALQKLSASRLYESSLNALRKLSKSLREEALRKLSESGLSKSSTKAG